MERKQGWESIKITPLDVIKGVGGTALDAVLFVTDRFGITDHAPIPYSLSDHCPDRLLGYKVGETPVEPAQPELPFGETVLKGAFPSAADYVRQAQEARREA